MMHRRVTSAVVARPVDEVFAWMTTPGSLLQSSSVTLGLEWFSPDDTLRQRRRPLKNSERLVGWERRIK
jgi:hypothetical protein